MSNSDKNSGLNQIRDDHFAKPWLGATLMELVTYIADFSEAGIEYVASGTEESPRDGLIVLFAHGLMLNAVSAGALGVRGSQLREPTATDIPIEVLRSERLSFDFETDNGRGSLSLNGTIWRDLRFDVEQIKKIWPEPVSDDTQAQESEEAVSPETPAAERGEDRRSGRKTVKETLTLKVLAEFDRLIAATECTFEHGEFTKISDKIADVTGYKSNSVQGIIRPGYKELKAARAASASVEANSPAQK